MRKILYLLIFLKLSALSGQQFTTVKRFSPPKFRSEQKDKSNLVVSYEVAFSDGDKRIRKVQTLLQIGDTFSKFFDANTTGRDSLLMVHSKLESVGAKELNELGRYNVEYKKSVLKDFGSNSIFYQERLSKNVYQYSEVFPKQNWKLENSKSTILGYNCKAASMIFRGRQYRAWYTEEIPKSDGPYIFGGLPGLILKVTDESGQYEFIATGIEKKSMEIYWRNEDSILSISRGDFRRLQQNYFENPSIFMSGKAYDETGVEISLQSRKRLYFPLELE